MEVSIVLNSKGEEEYYDSDGNRVSRGDITPTEYEGPMLKKRKDEMVTYVANGGSITEYLQIVGIPYAQYVKWRSADVKFAASVEMARAERANVTHEKFYQKNIKKLTEVDLSELNEDEYSDLKQDLSVIRRMQTILNEHKAQDSPKRFGAKGEQDVMIGNVEIHSHIKKEDLQSIVEVYTPHVDKGGKIVVQGSAKLLTADKGNDYNGGHGETRPPRQRNGRRGVPRNRERTDKQPSSRSKKTDGRRQRPQRRSPRVTQKRDS